MATTAPATVPLVHRVLGIGLVVTATAFLVLTYLGIGPMPVHDTLSQVIAYSLSTISVVLVAVALVVFRPRVPGRSFGQSVGEYWSTREVGAKVLPVWCLLEAAGTVAAVGYFLTREPVSAIVTGLTIVAFWSYGPNAFAKA